jgi:RNA polymerase sigma-70 factor (ECF subfamily)
MNSAYKEQFEQTMLPHLNAVYNLARWLTGDEHDARDVLQESYLRAFRFFNSYEGGAPKAWLLAIVRNTHEEAQNVSTGEPDAEARLIEAARAQTLDDCIGALAPEYREVLVMREFEEMSYREIAHMAGMPIGTVMSRLSRARKQLEQDFGCWGATEQKTRLRIQATSSVTSNGLRSGRNSPR